MSGVVAVDDGDEDRLDADDDIAESRLEYESHSRSSVDSWVTCSLLCEQPDLVFDPGCSSRSVGDECALALLGDAGQS